MPRVESGAEVTLVMLVYRSLRWMEWAMEGVDSCRNETPYRWLVVANDGTPEVRDDPRISVDWQNADADEPYINRVYRAWNEGVLNSPTNLCILMNSDMYGSDDCIDELIWCRQKRPKALPCGLLIEQGRIPSGMPEHVHDFGTNPDNFQKDRFRRQAGLLSARETVEPGRLFQPVLVDRQEFLDLGGYPEGNIGGVSGDKILFDRYVAAGFHWLTCKGSVWFHAQEGETRWP